MIIRSCMRTNEGAIPTCGSRTIRKVTSPLRTAGIWNGHRAKSVTGELPRCCDGNKTRREKNGMTLNSKIRSAQWISVNAWRDSSSKADWFGPSLQERATEHMHIVHIVNFIVVLSSSSTVFRYATIQYTVRKTQERNVSFHFHRVTHVVIYICDFLTVSPIHLQAPFTAHEGRASWNDSPNRWEADEKDQKRCAFRNFTLSRYILGL